MTRRFEDAARRLRENFDASFAVPRVGGREAGRRFVLLRTGDIEVAVAAEELLEVKAGVELLSLPSDAPALTGVAVVRGTVIAVFSLSRLLGRGATREPSLAMLRSVGAVALAFDEIGGFATVGDAQVIAGAHNELPFSRANLRLRETLVPVLDVEQLGLHLSQ